MDVIDQAQHQEEQARAIALDQIRYPILEDQVIDADGVVWCLDCEAPVGVERLGAVPHAVRCIGCQEQHEKMERLGL